MIALPRRLLLALLVAVLALALGTAPADDKTPDETKKDVKKPDPPPSDEKVLQDARLATDGPGLLDFFRKQTLSDADQKRIGGLIQQLGDKSFVVRERASAALREEGSRAVPLLRRAVKHPDAEVVFRVQERLDALGDAALGSRLAAAARLLRVRRPAGAAAVLLDYLPSAVDEQVEDEVLNSLALVGVEKDKVVAVAGLALEDKVAVRRAAAALVLGRSGTTEQRDAVRGLLDDRDAGVRFRAAQGLLAGRDKRALPALTALLSEGRPELAVRAEELLYCVAGAQAPRTSLGGNASTRKRCRAAWEQWWKANEKRIDLAKADVDLAPVNRTLQVRELRRRFLEALFQADETVLRQVTDLPFTLSEKKVYTEHEELEQDLFGVLADSSTGQRGTGALGPVLGMDNLPRLLTANERALLNPLRKPENRVVVVRAEVGGAAMTLCPVVRESKQGLHVIGLGMVQGVRQP